MPIFNYRYLFVKSIVRQKPMQSSSPLLSKPAIAVLPSQYSLQIFFCKTPQIHGQQGLNRIWWHKSPLSRSLSAMAPAQIVSSRLNLFFHPAQKSTTSLSCFITQAVTALMFRNEPMTISPADEAILIIPVPLVVL